MIPQSARLGVVPLFSAKGRLTVVIDGEGAFGMSGERSRNRTRASEGAFLWVMQAPLLLFKDSAAFSTESDK
jgi:hypothetical protein